MKNIFNLTLVSILFFIFFYKLEVVPNGFYVDEAVSAYNSYSVLETGKDEYGKSFPIAFRFFASFTPPLYVYATILPIKLWGLGVFTARFTSALSGLLSVGLVYLLLKELKLANSNFSKYYLILLFAISPWVIFYSRLGYEVYFAFLIFAIGVYFSLKSLDSYRYLPIAFGALSLSTYASHGNRYLVPIFVIVYIVVFAKHITKHKPTLLKAILVSTVIQIPNLMIINTSAFINKSSLFYSDAIYDRGGWYPIAALYEFFARYVTYLSPKSLFFLSDPVLQRSLPEISVFHFWLVLPYLYGFYLLLDKIRKPKYKFVLTLLVISPIPASLTQDPFSSQRALALFLPVFLAIAIGISGLLNKYKSNSFKMALLMLLGYSLLLSWRSYFVFFPVKRAVSWSYGYQQLFENLNKYETKVIIDQTRLKPSYIQYAFFNKYQPVKLQQTFSADFVNKYYYQDEYSDHYALPKIETRPIIWEEDIYQEVIIVGDKLSFSDKQVNEHFLTRLFQVTSPDGEIIFDVVRTNPTQKLNSANPEL